MGRKQKKKQKAPNDGGDDSSDSAGRTVCSHEKDSVNMGKVRKKVMNYKNQCEICDKLKLAVPEVNEKYVCLQCGTFTCSLDHSQVHFSTVRSDPHYLVYSVVQEKVWCHKCSAEVSLEKAKKVNTCVTTINSILTKNMGKSEDSSTSKLYGAESKQEVASTSSSPSKTSSLSDSFPPVRGLVNLGNTCFFNSVLQCLARTPHLLEELRKMEKPGRHVRIELKDGRVVAGELGKWDDLTEALAEVLRSLTERGTSNGTVNPSRLLSALRKKHSQFEGYDQHDAHELLRLLLDSVRTAEQRRYRALLFPQLGVSRKVNPAEVSKELGKEARDLDHQMSQVVTFTPEHIFRGYLVSKLECQECSHSTECVEGFLDLSLPIVVDKHQPPPLRRWSGSVEKKASGVDFELQANMSSTSKKKVRRRTTWRVHKGKGGKEESEDKNLPDLIQMTLSPSQEEEAFNCPDDGDVEDNDDPTKSDDRRRESGYSSEKGESYSSPRGSPALEEVNLTKGTPYDEDSARVSPNPLSAHEPFWHGNLDDFRLESIPQPNKVLVEGDPTLNGGWSQTRNPIPLLEDDTPDFARMFPRVDSSEKVQVLCRDSKTIMQEGGVEEGNEANESWLRPASEPAFDRILDAWNENEKVFNFSTDHASKDASPTRVTPDISDIGEDLTVDVRTYNDDQCDYSWDAPFAGCDQVSEDEYSLNAKDHVTPTCSPTISPILNGHLVGSPDASPLHIDMLRRSSPSPVAKSLNFTSCSPIQTHEELDRDDISWLLQDVNKPRQQGEYALFPSRGDGETLESGPVEAAGCSNDLWGRKNSTFDASENVSTDDPVLNLYKMKNPSPKAEPLSTTSARDDGYSIQGCLGQFTCVEMMAGNNKVGCSTCTERQNKGKEGKTVLTVWSKQLLIRSAPSVLILHLKRFQVLACSSRKLSKHVGFPFTLDLAKFCAEAPRNEANSMEEDSALGESSSSSSSLLYDLYGLVEHSGHLNSGHYVAYVKVVHKESTQWYCISDSRVSEVSQKTVSECQAYLLFYSRVGL